MNADLIFPISEYHKNKIASRKVTTRKLVPLTMGIDLEWINIEKMKIPYLENLKNNSFWITYFGSLGFQRKPEFMLNIIKKLLTNRYKNPKLILIGEANDRQERQKIYELIDEMNLQKNVILTGRVNRKVLQQYLWYSDVCISPIPPSKNYIISSPTKIYESLGHGIPVVANTEIIEQEKVIKESQGGILVKYDLCEFIMAIEKLILNSKLRTEMGQKGKTYVIENFAYDKLAMKIFPYFK
jgi:glycosyltransferase involved in cell wall biosynthesis